MRSHVKHLAHIVGAQNKTKQNKKTKQQQKTLFPSSQKKKKTWLPP